MKVSVAMVACLLFALIDLSPAAGYAQIGDRITHAIALKIDDGTEISVPAPPHVRAEQVSIPRGHGRRWAVISHVARDAVPQFEGALSDVWYVRNGRRFVVPLVNYTSAMGCALDGCRQAARWIRRRLGGSWRVLAP